MTKIKSGMLGALALVAAFAVGGLSQVGGGQGNPFGDGLLCTSGSAIRSQVQITDLWAASVIFADFNGRPLGQLGGLADPQNYQVAYRDPDSICGAGFNLTNAWTVTWQP